ncbi:MAG: Dabb family protein [Bacteroidales bacterium]|nr:Dabb family protein [Bacteroidales bacterium]MCF8455675.1 Dabb family protein [Bacteroidales bacterium]
MRKLVFSFLLFSLFLMGCGPEKLSDIQKPGLNHLVFLDLKEGLSQAQRDSLFASINKLESLVGKESFTIGLKAKTADPRMLNADLVIQTIHKDTQALKDYQKQPIHLQVIQETKSFLSGPPALFDYWEKD